MRPAVFALLASPATAGGLAAGFEEEGVPLELVRGSGDAFALAREAAGRSSLGLGVGGDASCIVLVLAAAPASPYLEAPAADARRFGHAAARVAARRPLRFGRPRQ
jgi:hypothetical protein